MIELCAISYSDSRSVPVMNAPFHRNSRHHMSCRRGNTLLFLQGDQPLKPFYFEGPRTTVICCADLIKADGVRSDIDLSSPAQHIARLYEQEGDRFVVGLRGSFAIILYDHRLNVLKAWTDHFGTQKLVYAAVAEVFAVATDLRSVSSILPEAPKLDHGAILKYLEYTCIPSPETIYRGISKLEPGHQLTSAPVPCSRPYWSMKYEQSRADLSEAGLRSNLQQAMRSAVSSNISDVTDSQRLGCFLSGGTDSSSITGLVRVLGRTPRTFSIGFDDKNYNELGFARIAASRFKTDHHEYFVRPADILTIMQKAAAAYDEPFGNSSIVPTYYCANLAAENGVKYLLAGDGGDELFGGNSRYVEDRVFQRYGRIPKGLRKYLVEPAVSAIRSRANVGVVDLAARYIRRSSIAMPDRVFSYSLLSSVPRTELFTFDFLSETLTCDPLQPARKHFKDAAADNDLNRWLYLDLQITIAENDLRKVTTMSQLAGITPRYPLLYPELAEFTGTIPAHLKVKGSQLRYLFKKAMADVLPPEIIKKTKHGFGLPYSVWLGQHTTLRDFTFDVLGSARCRQRGYFRSDLLQWLWSQYESVHQRYYGELLWIFLMLELWHLEHHDSQPSVALAQGGIKA